MRDLTIAHNFNSGNQVEAPTFGQKLAISGRLDQCLNGVGCLGSSECDLTCGYMSPPGPHGRPLRVVSDQSPRPSQIVKRIGLLHFEGKVDCSTWEISASAGGLADKLLKPGSGDDCSVGHIMLPAEDDVDKASKK